MAENPFFWIFGHVFDFFWRRSRVANARITARVLWFLNTGSYLGRYLPMYFKGNTLVCRYRT